MNKILRVKNQKMKQLNYLFHFLFGFQDLIFVIFGWMCYLFDC